MLSVLTVTESGEVDPMIQELLNQVNQEPKPIACIAARLSTDPPTLPIVPDLGDSHGLLVFIAAPHSECPMFEKDDNATVAWLKVLETYSKTHLVRAFILSDSKSFHAHESHYCWLNHPIVIGYGNITTAHGGLRLLRDEIRQAMTRMIERAGDRQYDTQRQFALKTWISIPQEEYHKHRLASFLVGGMQDTLAQFQRIHQIVTHSAPIRPLSEHLFRKLKGVQAAFDQVVDKDAHKTGPTHLDIWAETEPTPTAGTWLAPHVLLLGETGTGKTLLAKELHRMRFQNLGIEDPEDRKFIDDLFVEVNCAALGKNLAEGHIFGGLKGAWTSLNRNMPGAIFSSLGGTLFLDEFGELEEDVQAMLLKFLDTSKYYPSGGYDRPLTVPTLVIAATNRPLAEWMQTGAFRRDLVERFRLRLHLPSLKDRSGYLQQLCDFVLQNPSINPNGEITAISHRALGRLAVYPWPGNFRELEQVLWRAVYQARMDGLDCIRGRHILFSSQL